MAKQISIIGAGMVAQELHLPAIQYLEHAVSVVVDTEPEVRRQAKRRFKAARTASDLDAIDQSNTDLCIVCSPPDSHFAIAKTLMNRGVNLLIEKPLVNNLEEFDALNALDASGSARCFAGQMRRFFPNVRLLEQTLASGVFGKVQAITVSEGIPFTWQPKSGYLTDPEDEGVLTDTGAHTFDLATHLGAPTTDRLSVEKCLVDRYPQTNNLEFAARDTARDVTYEVKLSRDTKVANKIAVSTESALILTNALFEPGPLKVFLRNDGATPLYITSELEQYNMRYAYALQLESALTALSASDPTQCPVHISRIRPTIAFFDLVRSHLAVRPFEWGFAA
jgi:hypothetical protein